MFFLFLRTIRFFWGEKLHAEVILRVGSPKNTNRKHLFFLTRLKWLEMVWVELAESGLFILIPLQYVILLTAMVHLCFWFFSSTAKCFYQNQFSSLKINHFILTSSLTRWLGGVVLSRHISIVTEISILSISFSVGS